jgi:hypothetical protein
MELWYLRPGHKIRTRDGADDPLLGVIHIIKSEDFANQDDE